MTQPQRMTESIHDIPIKKTCCEEHKPRFPYTHSKKSYDVCCIQTSKNHNSNDICIYCYSDIALCLCPCALVLDILCCFPMVFGYCNVKKIKN
jgi:hypothetical protein